MIRHENDHGNVNVSTNVYNDIAGTAATNCFGVKGMAARSVKDGSYGLANVAPTVVKMMGLTAPDCWEESMV